MQEQLIINPPDSKTSTLLKQLLKKMNVAYASYRQDTEISEEQKKYVLDILNNTKEEDYLSEKDAKKLILQSRARK